MRLLTTTALLSALPAALSTPAPNNPPAAAPAAAPLPAPIYPRQNGGSIPDLLRLASLAGIPLPTNDPALLLSLGPLAAQLGSLLPTAPVLSALETAAPSGFVSKIVHDGGFASSFEEAFAAGSSPSWFLALPSDVRSYLHTYGAFTGVASALATDVSVVASLQSGAASARSARSGMTTESGSETATETDTDTDTDTESSASATATSGSTAGATSTSTGGAARETGVLAAGAFAMAGILGMAVAL